MAEKAIRDVKGYGVITCFHWWKKGGEACSIVRSHRADPDSCRFLDLCTRLRRAWAYRADISGVNVSTIQADRIKRCRWQTDAALRWSINALIRPHCYTRCRWSVTPRLDCVKVFMRVPKSSDTPPHASCETALWQRACLLSSWNSWGRHKISHFSSRSDAVFSCMLAKLPGSCVCSARSIMTVQLLADLYMNYTWVVWINLMVRY